MIWKQKIRRETILILSPIPCKREAGEKLEDITLVVPLGIIAIRLELGIVIHGLLLIGFRISLLRVEEDIQFRRCITSTYCRKVILSK